MLLESLCIIYDTGTGEWKGLPGSISNIKVMLQIMGIVKGGGRGGGGGKTPPTLKEKFFTLS